MRFIHIKINRPGGIGMVRLFNDEWRFLKTNLDGAKDEVLVSLDQFSPVEVPHDWLIYNVHNLYENSCGWYYKKFQLSSTLDSLERVILRFDGVYMDSTVYINNQKVGDWKYGYSAITLDITKELRDGENEVLVQVRYQSPNSRWYSGAGVYRNVWIKECSRAYLPLDGSYITSKVQGDDYLLEVGTEVDGQITNNIMCQYSLWYEDEIVQDFGLKKVSIGNSDINETNTASLKELVKNPNIWDVESPHCYELRVTLYDMSNEEELDSERITIGFRTMKFDPEEGFILNGRRLKVHGVCEHHDFGCLGAAFHKEAMRRKFRILREMGVNALRTSHNMPAKEVMELADEMGFLVVNEAFDMWERSKTEYDYGRFFLEWANEDVKSWIRRDRNHPSLMLWSIGNEIYDTHADEYGQEITKRLVAMVREHDPKENALITIGSNYMPWENARKCADIVKIAGYNYAEKYYEAHHEKYKDWVIYGSETASLVQSRGVYKFPLSRTILSDEDEQCSALGNSTTSWGAKSVEQCIIDDRDAEFCFGQFIWTGFDYIGEPTPYHTKNSYFGQIDTAGFPKDAFYIFKSAWTDATKNPMVHVFPYWDFNEGQLIDIRACTNGAMVELFVNDISYGRQAIDHINGKKLLGEWKVPFSRGTIKAIAYDIDGKPIACEVRHSFFDAKEIVLSTNQTTLLANGEDLCFLTISVVDENQNPVENAMNYVKVDIDGSGRLLGLDNGDSTDYDQYKSNVRKLFQGKLLAVIGSTFEEGEINVTVSGEGLKSSSIKLIAMNSEIRKGICAREDFRDCDRSSVGHPNIPVRKIELSYEEGNELSENVKELICNAYIYPKNATDTDLTWMLVNNAGIEISYAVIEEIRNEGNVHSARIKAYGDGEFYVKCMSKSGTDKIKIISTIEAYAKGLGQAYLNPYEFISAGLFSDTIGDIGNGNEKGISTSRDGMSGVIYKNIDFGDYGSDEITIPIFALSSERYEIEIWQGSPLEEESEKLTTVSYQKESIWNTYQEETYRLPCRIKGIATIAFVLKNKVHIKGFCFKKLNKAISKINAAECNRVYGDDFLIEPEAVTGIGNNVSLEFESMDFGEEGVSRIEICGRTPLPVNTIHIHLTKEDGTKQNCIVEFDKRDGSSSDLDYVSQSFEIDKFKGKGMVTFVFLPGSKFDFHSFQFIR